MQQQTRGALARFACSCTVVPSYGVVGKCAVQIAPYFVNISLCPRARRHSDHTHAATAPVWTSRADSTGDH